MGILWIDNQCHIANSHKSWFANRIVKGHDGLYYVSQFASGKIFVYSLEEDSFLLKIDKINVNMGLDNPSVDLKAISSVPGFERSNCLWKH